MSEDNSAIYRRVKMDDWPSGLKRHLILNYPGCKSAKDAVQKLLREKNSGVKTQKPDFTSPKASEKEIAAKLKQVQDHIALKSDGIDLDKIPQGERMSLARMPLDSIESIRLWGFAWLEAIKKAQSQP